MVYSPVRDGKLCSVTRWLCQREKDFILFFSCWIGNDVIVRQHHHVGPVRKSPYYACINTTILKIIDMSRWHGINSMGWQVVHCMPTRNRSTFNSLFLTRGDWSITKPSSAALSTSVWITLTEATGVERAKEDVEAEPLLVSIVAGVLTGAGLGGNGGLVFPFKSLVTYSRNPPS